MSVEVGIWRVDNGIKSIVYTNMDKESQLQEIVADDISIIDDRLMVVGREVESSYGTRIDVLAIDQEGGLVIIELKRDKTPRDVVAQILDYASWVRHMTADEIAQTFIRYQERFLKLETPRSIDEALTERFGGMPDDLNASHRMIVVAGELDPPTERIIDYMREEYEIDINVVFFRVFKDGERQYLTRAWLEEPEPVSSEPTARRSAKGAWNGEFYVSFGEGPHRRWSDAKKYGFVSAGGGPWYVNTLTKLQPGNRIWVNVPRKGYVAVGKVISEAVPFDKFSVRQDETAIPITQVEVEAPEMFDEQHGEYIVGVDWIKAVDTSDAVKERGFFGNQHTVAQPRAAQWDFTVKRLKMLWGVS